MEYLWITYPVVSLSQSSASAAYWLCMTEDLNYNNFFLSQKSSKYLCKIWILGIFRRNIVLKEVIFCPIIPLLSASFYNVNNFCAMYSCKWMLHLWIPCVFQWFEFPTPPWQDSNFPPSQEKETNAYKFPGGWGYWSFKLTNDKPKISDICE